MQDFALNNNNRNFLIFSNAFNILLNLISKQILESIPIHILNVEKKFNKFNQENLNNFIKFYWISSYKGIFGLPMRIDGLAKKTSHADIIHIYIY